MSIITVREIEAVLWMSIIPVFLIGLFVWANFRSWKELKEKKQREEARRTRRNNNSRRRR